MTDDVMTVPRKLLEDLSRRLEVVEAKLAELFDEDGPDYEPDEGADPLSVAFRRFVRRVRQRERQEDRRLP